jgi:Rap1a immunity proteins
VPNAGQLAFCAGFVAGLIDALSSVQEVNKATAFCINPNVQGQATDIVKVWLRDHPEKRHLRGASVVLAAIREKFPCN